MRKKRYAFTFLSSLVAFIGMLAAAPVLAASLSLSPGAVSADRGESFTASVYLNTGGTDIYTAKVVISFPSDLVTVESFSFAGGWTPLSQPGYDSIDNAGGTLIKTGGYAGGVSGTVAFGTVTFRADKAGDGSISTQSGSLALDAEGNNVFAGISSASLQISGPVTEVAPAPATPSSPTQSPQATAPAPPSQPESGARQLRAPSVTNQDDAGSPVNAAARAPMGFSNANIAGTQARASVNDASRQLRANSPARADAPLFDVEIGPGESAQDKFNARPAIALLLVLLFGTIAIFGLVYGFRRIDRCK